MNADMKINNMPLKSPIKMPVEMKKKELSFFQHSLDFRNFFEKKTFLFLVILTHWCLT